MSFKYSVAVIVIIIIFLFAFFKLLLSMFLIFPETDLTPKVLLFKSIYFRVYHCVCKARIIFHLVCVLLFGYIEFLSASLLP